MMPSSAMVARVRRVRRELDEMNFRLRILRDSFQATTIAGQRLVEKARNSAAEPAGARKASRPEPALEKSNPDNR
jgi:hypothetical protein